MLRLIAYRPLASALAEGVGEDDRIALPFITRIAALPGMEIAGELDGPHLAERTGLGPLRGIYRLWQGLATGAKHAGFELAARPMLLLPVAAERLSAFGAMAAVQRRAAEDWRAPVHDVSASALADYRRLRASLEEGDLGRLSRWVGSLDVVTGPPNALVHSPVHRLGLAGQLGRIAAAAVHTGLVQRATPVPQAWPASLSFIMRQPLLTQFAAGLFATLDALEAEFVEAHAVAIGEFLLGLFLADLRMHAPTLRVHHVPDLRLERTGPPASLPRGFDPAAYLRLNPDVASAGQDGAEHYLRHGYQERRVWTVACD